MANLIVTLISIAVILSGVSLIAQGSFKSMGDLSDDWKQMEVRSGDISRTEIEVVSHHHHSNQVDIVIENSGQTPLNDFMAWDVVVEYYQSDGTYHQLWFPYTSAYPPGDNQWSVEGIFRNDSGTQSEVYQPGILNPAEYVIIRAKVNPTYNNNGRNHIIIGTPNGVTVSTMF